MPSRNRTTPTHLLVFDDPSRTVDAVRRLRAAGFTVADVHSPFPLHGLEEALGWPETRLPYATLAGGVLGGGLALSFQAWTHARSWPLDIGGKPYFALPAYVPIGFELTVLFATIFTLVALVRLAWVYARRRSDALAVTRLRVTDDRFAVLVSEGTEGFSVEQFRKLCDELSPIECIEAAENPGR